MKQPGLSVAPGNGPGLLNLLVGNGYGDVLILARQGRWDVPDPGKSRVALGRAQPARAGSGGGAGRRPAEQSRDDARRRRRAATSTRRCRRSAPRPRPRQSSWRLATSSGRSSTRGRPCPTPIVVSTGSNSVDVYRTTSINERRAHLRPVAGDLFRRHGPGERDRGRHEWRRHSRHADRQPGQQRRLGGVRLLQRPGQLGGHRSGRGSSPAATARSRWPCRI